MLRNGQRKSTNMAYKDLVRELAVTDFKLKYQGSVLGYLWSFAKPLMLFAVLYVVFTRFVRFGDGKVDHYSLYLLLGIVLWSYFTDATSGAMGSIVDRGDLIRKVYFPRIVIVIAASISSLITLLLNLIVVFLFMVVARIPFHLSLPVFLLLVVELYVLSLGCSLLLSALYVKFRDFRHIWEVGLQILFYASPIIYPLSLVPQKYVPLLTLSPITQIIQDARWLLITHKTVTAADTLHLPWVLVPYLLPVIILWLGYSYFVRTAAAFAEEI
jgi:ABC-2 type transport system permease protein